MKIHSFCLGLIFLVLCGCAPLSRQWAQLTSPVGTGPEWEYIYEADRQAAREEFGKAAENYRTAVSLTSYGSATWHKLASVYAQMGDFYQAAEAELQGHQANISLLMIYYSKPEIEAGKGLDSEAFSFSRLSRYYLALGDTDKAYQACVMSVDHARLFLRGNPGNEEHVSIVTNQVWGAYWTEVGNYAKGIQYYEADLERQKKNDGRGFVVARAENKLGMPVYYSGDFIRARDLFRAAAGSNETGWLSFPADLWISLKMLGKAEARLGNGEKAMSDWQEALKILDGETMVGFRVERSDVLNEIGKFQFRNIHPEAAQKAFLEAIELRRATDTQTHPNCAVAVKGLADVAALEAYPTTGTTGTAGTEASLVSFAQRDDLVTSATALATQALGILDASVLPTHPRTGSVLVALGSLDILTGNPAAAAPLDARLDTILQKPLGPWKEDFLDTAKFYAGILRRAGKPDAADRLDALIAQQSDKP